MKLNLIFQILHKFYLTEIKPMNIKPHITVEKIYQYKKIKKNYILRKS